MLREASGRHMQRLAGLLRACQMRGMASAALPEQVREQQQGVHERAAITPLPFHTMASDSPPSPDPPAAGSRVTF